MELIDQLVGQLGINEQQAKGGAGLLFKLAQDKLGSSDFSNLAQQVPGVEDLVKDAPSSGGLGSALGAVGSMLGGKAGSLGGLAAAASGFSKLGLSSDMVGKFVPIVLSFVRGKGGDGIGGILEKVLR